MWDQYDGEVPVREYAKGGTSFSSPEGIDEAAYGAMIGGNIDITLELSPEAKIVTKKVQDAVFRLKNRKKSLQESIPRNKDKEQEINEKIDKIDEDIERLISNDILEHITDVAESSVQRTTTDLADKKKLNDNDIVQAIEEMSAMNAMIDSVLEVDDFDAKGNPTYVVKNKSVTDRAEEVMTKIRKKQNDLNVLAIAHLARKITKKSGEIVTVEDLKTYKDINLATQQILDLSRVDNKLAQYLNSILQRANRDVMTEYSDELSTPLKDLEAKAGMDLTKSADAKQFMQLDDKGNTTPNLLDEYSQEYLDFKDNTLKQINYYNRQDSRDYVNRNKNLDKENKKFIKEHVIANVSKLLEESTTSTELDRLAEEIGIEKAEELRNEAIKSYNTYLDNYDSYHETVLHRHELKERGYVTLEEIEGKLSRYERRNDPIKLMEQINKKEGTLIDIRYDNLAYAPKKNSKWYDKRYEALKKENAKFELYKFITNKLEEFKTYLPPSEVRSLQRNYLPEIMKDGILEDLKGIGKGAFTSRLLKMISMGEEGIVDKNIIGADGKPKRSIPIKFTDDKIGKMHRKINRDEQLTISINENINERKRNIKELIKEGFKDIANTEKGKLAKDERILTEIQERLPGLKEKYKEQVNKQSIDLIQAVKMFGMMAINYKHKAKVEDASALALKVLKEANAVKTNALGKVKLDETGKPITTDDSKLVAQAQHAINALIYGQYKATKGMGTRKVGKTKEARARLKVLRKERRGYMEKFRTGKLKKATYNERMEDVNNRIDEVEEVNHVNAAKFVDSFMGYSYIVGMGWNPLSATANVIYGKMANAIEGASGQFFTNRDRRRAERMLWASTGNSVGIRSDQAKKIRSLVAKYGVMFDMLEDSYGSNRAGKERLKKLGLALPLEMQRRGEYYNQGTVLIANLLNKKVKTTKGEMIDLFDAYDINGNIKEGLLADPEAWKGLTEAEEGNEFTKLRNRVLQLNKRLHGNYDPSSPMLAKKTALGRALVMFKSWMPEGFATRFEKEKYDPQLQSTIKGRYRTYGSLGFMGSVKTLHNLVVRKSLVENSEFEEVDIQNMKRNLREIWWGLALLTLYILAKVGLDDEDEKTIPAKLTLNMINRIQGDITLYLNPGELYKMSKNPTPLLRTAQSVIKLPGVVYNTIMSDNAAHDGEYSARNILKTIPLAAPVGKVLYPY